jgi:hypothetical protein
MALTRVLTKFRDSFVSWRDFVPLKKINFLKYIKD